MKRLSMRKSMAGTKVLTVPLALQKTSPNSDESFFFLRGRAAVTTENVKFRPENNPKAAHDLKKKREVNLKLTRTQRRRQSTRRTKYKKHKSLREIVTSKLVRALKNSYSFEPQEEGLVEDPIVLGQDSPDAGLRRSLTLSMKDFPKTSANSKRNSLRKSGAKERDVTLVSTTPEKIIDEQRRKENAQVQGSVINASTFEEVDPVSQNSFGRLTSNHLDLKMKLNEEFQKALRQKRARSVEEDMDDDCSEDSFVDMSKSNNNGLIEKLRSQKEKFEHNEENPFVKAEVIQTLEQLNSLSFSGRSSTALRRTSNSNQAMVKRVMHNSFRRKKSEKFKSLKKEEFDSEFLVSAQPSPKTKKLKPKDKKESMTIDESGKIKRKKRTLKRSSAMRLLGTFKKRLSVGMGGTKCLEPKVVDEVMEVESGVENLDLFKTMLSESEDTIAPKRNPSVVNARKTMIENSHQGEIRRRKTQRNKLKQFKEALEKKASLIPHAAPEGEEEMKNGKKLRMHSLRKRVSYKERRTSQDEDKAEKEIDSESGDESDDDSLLEVPMPVEVDDEENRERSSTIIGEDLEIEEMDESAKSKLLLYL